MSFRQFILISFTNISIVQNGLLLHLMHCVYTRFYENYPETNAFIINAEAILTDQGFI